MILNFVVNEYIMINLNIKYHFSEHVFGIIMYQFFIRHYLIVNYEENRMLY